MAQVHLHTALKSVAVADITTTLTAANTLVPSVPGKRYCIVDYTLRAIGGNAGGSTTLQIVNGAEVACSMGTTDVDQNVINRPESANVTATHLGHWGVGGASTSAKDVTGAIGIIRTGTVTTGASGIEVMVHYLVEGCN